MLIDFHAHTFTDKLCPGAVNSLADKAHLIPYTDGSMSQTKEFMAKAGVDKFVSLSISVSERTQSKVNDYAIEINDNDNVFAFGSIHPFASNFKDELKRLNDAGIKGVKFHNEYQEFYVDDERAYPAYDECIKYGMIILFHGGEDLGYEPPVRATPEKMRKVYDDFNYDKFVFAHLGGLNMQSDAIKFLADTKVMIDTSFAVVGGYNVEQVESIIDAFTPNRVLFGSDCPWDNPKDIHDLLLKTKYSKEEKEQIFFKNACRLLKI